MPPVCDRLLELARRLVKDGVDDESLLANVRQAGGNVFDSIKLLCALRRYSLKEAKRTVHLSNAWSDCRGDFDKLHDDLIDAVRGMDHVVYKERD